MMVLTMNNNLLSPPPKLLCRSLSDNKIKNIISMLKNQKIDVKPPYQRDSDIWNTERQQLFINSILSGYDIPKLYFHRHNLEDISKNGQIYSVIDGNQRLKAIHAFINDELKLDNTPIYYNNNIIDVTNKTFSQLLHKHEDICTYFMNYQLPIITVVVDDNEIVDVISEMFLRLNKGISANSAEKRNAMANSNVIKNVKKLVKHDFFTKKLKISSKRYKHEDLACKFLFFEYCLNVRSLPGIEKKNLDIFAKYFIGNPLSQHIKSRTKHTLDNMLKMFNDNDELLSKQTIIPIYYLLAYCTNDDDLIHIRNKLKNFINDVHVNYKKMNLLQQTLDIDKSINKDLTNYYIESLQGTTRATSIMNRCIILANYIGIDINKLKNLSDQLPRELIDYSNDGKISK